MSDTGAAPPPIRRRRVIASAAVGMVVALLVAALAVRLGREDNPIAVDSGGNPILDLLAWIPASDVTSAEFAVWTPDSGLAIPSAASESFALANQLAVDPELVVVGSTSSYFERYGWSLSQVTGWAVAGAGGDLTVLTGDFDGGIITERLAESGYSRSEYRGARLFVLGEGADALNAIAELDGRLIVSSSDELVRRAIDSVVDGEGSLADNSTIAAMARAMAPLSGLVAVDQARHAAMCAPDLVASGQPLSGRYAMVGYGRAGDGGERRTLMATSFGDEAAASIALPVYESGWRAGYANADGLGGRIEDYGELTAVRQSGGALIAELTDGRDEGWVRSGIRFAIPVCEASMAIAKPATTVPFDRTQASMPRLAASLPEIEGSGEFRAVDFAAISTARSISTPGESATAAEIEAWLERLTPAPAFVIAPVSPRTLLAWADAFETEPRAISGMAEYRPDAQGDVVGVMVGDWDIDRITVALEAKGYEWRDIDGVRQFAPRGSVGTVTSLMSLAGGGWENIAIQGDRLWFSANQGAMRDVIATVTTASPAFPVRQPFLDELLDDASSLEIVGIEAYQHRDCGAVRRDVTAVAAGWSARSSGEGAEIAYLVDPTAIVPNVVAQLDEHVGQATVTIAQPATGSPQPEANALLIDLLDYLGAESASSSAGNVVVARFNAPESGRVAGIRFFEGATGSCRFASVE
jgi:hypothetical protein